MTDYRQTVEEAAEILDAIRRGDSDWVIDESLVPRLRAGLATALERAREEERERWHRMIEGQLAAERKGIETGEARNRELHHYSILVLEYIRDTWPLAAQEPVPPASPCGGCPSAKTCEEWPADPCPHRPTPPPTPAAAAGDRARTLTDWLAAQEPALAPTRAENSADAAEALRDIAPYVNFDVPMDAGEMVTVTAADAEPFCACGRRVSECDGSRAGCRTQCREEEGNHD